MARFSKSSKDPLHLERHKALARKFSTSIKRRKWRTVNRPSIKRTPVQLTEQKARRAARKKLLNAALAAARDASWAEAKKLREEFGGHDIGYYHKQIIHSASTSKGTHLPPGERRKAGALSADIARQWRAMSDEEQHRITVPLIKEVEELREMKKCSTHNVPLEAFADANASIRKLEEDIHTLHARTGIEVICIAVRSSVDDYLRPHIITTSERGQDFVRLITKSEISSFAVRFEGFCVSGAEGVVKNFRQDLLQLKKETASLIFSKLQAVAKSKIARMNYADFAKAITAKHGIIIEGWPLRRFCSPSDLQSRNEVQVLFNAWTQGSAKFRLLSTAEWEEWNDRDFDAQLAATSGPGADDLPANADNVCAESTIATASAVPARESIPASSASDPSSNALTLPSASAVPIGEPTSAAATPSPNEPSSSSTTENDGRPSKKSRPLVNLPAFVNAGVTDANGIQLITGKKPRKERSDKGIKRGSRKGKAQCAQPLSSSGEV